MMGYDEEEKPYRIRVSVRNNKPLKAIEKNGYKSVAEFERDAGVKMGRMNNLVSMREAPLTQHGEFSSLAQIAMEMLGAAPTDLWTAEQLTLELKRNSGERAVDATAVHELLSSNYEAMTLPSPEDALLEVEKVAVIDQALSRLTPTEQRVMRMRYQQDATLAQCAEAFKVTGERIRQVEQKALRKLRNTPVLKELLNKDEG